MLMKLKKGLSACRRRRRRTEAPQACEEVDTVRHHDTVHMVM